VGELYGSRLDGVRKVLRSGEQELCEFFLHFESREGENHKVSLKVETQEVQADSRWLCYPDSYYFTITKRLLDRNYEVYRCPTHTKAPSDAFDPI
jgi:hypothetical protein